MAALFRRDGTTSNRIFGLILLVALFVFVSPNVFLTLLSRSAPGLVDEGIPCTRLRQAVNRGAHQSLIGRSSRNPISLRVQPDAVPFDPNYQGQYLIRLVIQNETVGSVPIVFNERQILSSDDPFSSGFGLVFSVPVGLNPGGTRQQNLTTIPESDIRILGPKQRCVHRLYFPANQLDANLRSGTVTVRAYYRITTNGAVLPQTQSVGIVYPDQGLGILPNGIVVSDPIPIPLEAAPTQ